MRPALAAAAVLVAAGLGACSEAQDAVDDAASDAACSAARSAADQAGDRAGRAAEDIGADPRQAQQDLQTVRSVLTAAERSAGVDLEKRIAAVRAGVDDLLGEARDAAGGADPDLTAVDRARQDVDDAVADVKGLC